MTLSPLLLPPVFYIRRRLLPRLCRLSFLLLSQPYASSTSPLSLSTLLPPRTPLSRCHAGCRNSLTRRWVRLVSFSPLSPSQRPCRSRRRFRLLSPSLFPPTFFLLASRSAPSHVTDDHHSSLRYVGTASYSVRSPPSQPFFVRSALTGFTRRPRILLLPPHDRLH
jgi:hypothetical protein